MRISDIDVSQNLIRIEGEGGDEITVNADRVEEFVDLLRRGKSALGFAKGPSFPIEKNLVVFLHPWERTGAFKGMFCGWCTGGPRWRAAPEHLDNALACDNHKHDLESWVHDNTVEG